MKKRLVNFGKKQKYFLAGIFLLAILIVGVFVVKAEVVKTGNGNLH